MFYELDFNGFFICDAPFATEVSQTIVDTPPLNPDGTGMRKAMWTGTWDAANLVWTNGGWVDDEASLLAADLATEQLARDNAIVKKALIDIDIASVRAIREWLVSQSNPPAILVDHEMQAQTERAKLK